MLQNTNKVITKFENYNIVGEVHWDLNSKELKGIYIESRKRELYIISNITEFEDLKEITLKMDEFIEKELLGGIK